MAIHYNIKVKGRVQGVFFRVSTRSEAESLGLVGFVRNEPDGSVYIEVEGEQQACDRLNEWVRRGGPPQGEVDEIELDEGEVIGFSSFEIR